MRPKLFTLSDDDVDNFRTAVTKWADLFGLTDWNIEVYVAPKLDATAECESNHETRLAKIRVARKFRLEPTVAFVESVAAHEVFHLLLADLTHVAIDRNFGQDAREAAVRLAEEAATVRFENFIRNYYLPIESKLGK